MIVGLFAMKDFAVAKIRKDLIGAAGVYHVTSELSRRGLVALPTVRNAAAADVLVWSPSSGRHAVLQVKTSQEKVKFWPTSGPGTCLRGSRAFYVFLRWNQEGQCFECFLESARKVVSQVEQHLADQQQQGQEAFPFWTLPQDARAIKALTRRWRNWRP